MPTLKTVGDLRQQLKADNLQWTVNPAFSDTMLVKRPPLGGDLTNVLLAANVPAVNIAALVQANPTTNIHLRAHLVQRGLLSPSLLGTMKGSFQLAAPAPVVAGASGGANPPASVDWRNRWTWNYITRIRDQDPCEHCWIYSATALVEAMVRIEHCVWAPRSEGDYIEANKVPCGQCGSPGPVLDWYESNGVCDQSAIAWADTTMAHADPYYNPAPTGCGTGSMRAPTVYSPPSNRNGKTIKIPKYTSLGKVADQKNWIDAIGPLVVSLDVYSDFFAWSGNSPYIKSSTASYDGGHVMLAVGYDDNLKCWICKNSWGTGYGNGGFYLVGYGQCKIDDYAKLGVQYTNPDPWTKRLNHSGCMIESGNGSLHRNFELLAPSHANSMTHWWRDNSSGSFPWHKAETMASDVSSLPTFTGTTYNRNFETVYRTTGERLHHWWFDQSSSKWNNGVIFGPVAACGEPGFCESGFGQGNLEVVIAVVGGSIEHWWRAGAVWAKSVSFAAGVKNAGQSLLQSSYGNVEFVATLSSGQMQHWYRQGASWLTSATFGSNAASGTCMIQGQFGENADNGTRNFELIVAMNDGTVQHWWRNNGAAGIPWVFGATFGSNIQKVVALLQGSFGFNLEAVVLRNDGQLQHYYRDDGGWHADPGTIGTTL